MLPETVLKKEEVIKEAEKVTVPEPEKEDEIQTQTQTQTETETRSQELEEVKQTFRVRPENTQVRMGENVYLCCIVDHQQGKAQWTKDGFALGEY